MAMRCALASLIGFTDLWFSVWGIRGVCSQVRRLAKAREVGRQKERELQHCSSLTVGERSEKLGMERSCVDMVVLELTRFGWTKDYVGGLSQNMF